MSDILFVSTKYYEERAIEIIKDKKRVFNVGALSIDNLQNQKFFSKKEFEKEFKIDLEIPTILSTYHPETKSLENNKKNISQLVKAFEKLSAKYQIVITMPNADTLGLMIRNELIKLKKNNKKVILIESFGMKGYLSCMKYCSFLLGNTSSGFVEAAHFPKYVINIGDRQKGRLITPNIFSISPLTDEILKTVNIIEQSPLQKNLNVYGNGDAAENIVAIIKKIKL
jgi:GDP/UDP-N,N'-diacetylbacillosamine 2-epimerase (hydrolysing)